MSADVECLVIGAGVVGLAVARALALTGREVMVLERHDLIGSEVSSRNSEVIHGGLYYPPGSLRARFCVAGKKLLYQFCAENGVKAQACGKLLVATQEAEVPRLQAIMANAAQNGIHDLQALTAEEARALEPALTCHAACLSPSTGVVDSHGLMVALEGHLEASGGQVVLRSPVSAVRLGGDGLFHVTVESPEGIFDLTSRWLINAAGLGASAIGQSLGQEATKDYQVPATYPAKGHYYHLTGKAPFRHLIYPMPDGAWLGVHLTLDVGGKVKFGPDLEWVEGLDYSFDEAGGERQKTFEREIRRYWPDLPDGALSPDYVGIRPKLYRQGEAAADFTIHDTSDHGIARYIGLYGIESPGLTSSMAIAEAVAAMAGAQTS